MKTFNKLLITVIISSLVGCQKAAKDRLASQEEYPGISARANEKASPHTKQFTAEIATAWFNLLAQITKNTPYNPPQSIRIFVYSGMALYESVVPGMPSYQSMYKHLTGNQIEIGMKKDYYWPACANAALALIATKIFQNYSPNPDLTLIQQLESSLNASFQQQIPPEQLALSTDFGRYVANIIYEWAKTDGTLNSNGSLAICPPHVPSGLPGKWIPTPPGFFSAAGACQGDLRTFVPNVVNTTLATAPPPYSTDPSSSFYQMANEIYQLSFNLSDNDHRVIQAWRDILGTNYNTPSHMLKLTAEIVDKEKLDLEEASAIYAQVTIAMFDAIAATFESKFTYLLLRPVTYIKDVMGQANWNSVYPTPGHPAYPAVAPSAAAAAAYILEKSFGNNYSFVDSTQKNLYGSWNYNSLGELVDDVGKSRTHSGINFRSSVTEGIEQGRKVGQMVNQLPFKKA